MLITNPSEFLLVQQPICSFSAKSPFTRPISTIQSEVVSFVRQQLNIVVFLILVSHVLAHIQIDAMGNRKIDTNIGNNKGVIYIVVDYSHLRLCFSV